MNWQNIKTHLLDLLKAIAAAAAVAAIQIIIKYLSSIDFGNTSSLINGAAAFFAVKITK